MMTLGLVARKIGRVNDWVGRYIAKGKEAEMSPEYDSLSEGTVSQYKWVDGVIVQVDGGDQEMEDV
jgi:hypothetical protein